MTNRQNSVGIHLSSAAQEPHLCSFDKSPAFALSDHGSSSTVDNYHETMCMQLEYSCGLVGI